MRYHALACDYDGTLARDSRVPPDVIVALQRVVATGRKLILVTGRQLSDLLAVFPEAEVFHRVVAENGAILYDPAVRQETALAARPPESFLRAIRERGVPDVSAGRVIVATWQPHEVAVLAAIRDLGLELQVIFNKGAVMVLPAGVNKATGLQAALESLALSRHEVVGIGDAENDYAFLSVCECAVAVANALPALIQRADWTTRGDHGEGVTELIRQLIADDLASREDWLIRHHLVLGSRPGGEEVRVSPRGPNILIAGPSGSGKSTATTSFIERLTERQYQYCIIDPEGDYEGLEGAITLGRTGRVPVVDEVLDVLAKPEQSLVVNLIGLPVGARPPFFTELLPRLQEMRSRSGRPHWLVADEAHHLFPASWEPAGLVAPQDLERTVFVTVHPDQISPFILRSVGTVMAVGSDPRETFRLFCQPLQMRVPQVETTKLKPDEVLFWPLSKQQRAFQVKLIASKTERHRHTRKYAVGELPADRSFYFHGPDGRLNLRAQNLSIFLQIADGLDPETWMFHLRQGDYSAWFRDCIKDDALAAETEAIERQVGLSAEESRARIRELVERYYTLPAAASSPESKDESGAPPIRQKAMVDVTQGSPA